MRQVDVAEFAGLHAGRRADIQRVLGRQAGIDARLQFGRGRGIEDGKLRALLAGIIEEQPLGAAREAGDGDAAAARQPRLGEGEAALDEIVERRTAQHAELAADGVEHLVVAGERAGVARRRFAAARAAAELQHEQRLLRGERLLGGGEEGVGPAHALDHAGDDPRRFVLDQEIDVVGEVEIELVAARHGVGKAQAAHRRVLQPELERAARLEDDADLARGQRAHARGGIKQQLLAQRDRAHAIGARDAEIIARAELAHRLGTRLAFAIAALAEARGVDERAFQPMRRAVGERAGHERRRNDGQREVDGLGDRGEAGIDGLAPQRAAPRIDEIDFGGKAAMREIVVDRLRPAVAAFIGRADDGDRLGPQQSLDGTEQRGTPSPIARLAVQFCIGSLPGSTAWRAFRISAPMTVRAIGLVSGPWACLPSDDRCARRAPVSRPSFARPAARRREHLLSRTWPDVRGVCAGWP